MLCAANLARISIIVIFEVMAYILSLMCLWNAFASGECLECGGAEKAWGDFS
jgi:hypothetical protein